MSDKVRAERALTLRAARQRIEDPDHWIQGMYACDRHGMSVEPDSDRARRWCAIGAIRWAATFTSTTSTAIRLAEQLGGIAGDTKEESCAVAFNDSSAHAEVLGLFDRAIEAYEQSR